MATNNYAGWLEAEPSALYNWYTNQMANPYQKSYAQGQYGNAYGGYTGALAGQIKSGQEPTMQWADYLKDYPWLAEFNKQSPYNRGERPTVYNPRRQWMIY